MDDAGGPTVRVKIVLVGDGAAGKTSLLSRYASNTCYDSYIPTVHEQVTQQQILNIDGKQINVCTEIWDTPGQEDFDRLRPLCYPNTTVVFYCFAISSKHSSFSNVKSMWIPELHHHLISRHTLHTLHENTKDIMIEYLVACKCDLKKDAKYWRKLVQGYIRQESKTNKVRMPQELTEMCLYWIFDETKHEKKTANEFVQDSDVRQLLDDNSFHRLQKYVETSAVDGSNVHSLFEEAIRASVEIQLHLQTKKNSNSKSCALL